MPQGNTTSPQLAVHMTNQFQNRRPLIQSAFRTSRALYALQHIDALNDAFDKNPTRTVDPVLYVDSSEGPSACCHVARGNVRIACPVRGESRFSFFFKCKSLWTQSAAVDPTFVFAFLQTFLDILQEYLGDVTAGTIRENFDTVYQARHSTHVLENGNLQATRHSSC